MCRLVSRFVRFLVLAVCACVVMPCCTHETGFDIGLYSLEQVESVPGTWDSGVLTSDPSIEALVIGPDECGWLVCVEMVTGLRYTVTGRTGERIRCVLDGLGFSPNHTKSTATVSVLHAETREVLSVRKNVVVCIEGDFGEGGEDQPGEDEPEAGDKSPCVTITGAELVLDGNDPISISSGSFSFEIQKYVSASLRVFYSLNKYEEGPISCQVSDICGGESLEIGTGSIEHSVGSFYFPVEGLQEGKGRFRVNLSARHSSTSVLFEFTVLPNGHVIEFKPNTFCFYDQIPAYGKIIPFGFDKGETYDVVLHYKERDSGEEGETVYRGLSSADPAEVLLWESGKAKDWYEVTFWAELFLPGINEAVFVTTPVKVSVFRPDFLWWEEDGETMVRSDSMVCSRSASSIVRLGVTTGYSKYGHIKQMRVYDINTGKSFNVSSPEPGTDGCFVFRMTHPSRGSHSFTIYFDTDEGTYRLSTSKAFRDVWTVTPFIDGSSFFAAFDGPLPGIDMRCILDVSVDIYAVFNYTMALTRDGEPYDEPMRWWHFIETRGFDYTIEQGTGQSDLLIYKGWINTGLKHIRKVAGGKDWSITGGVATRWSSDESGKDFIEEYKPDSSCPGVILRIKADKLFTDSYHGIAVDYSRIRPVLDDYGITY